MMTKSEHRLTALLLEMGGREFSNHGCCDFDLRTVIEDEAERDAIVRGFHEWNGSPEEYEACGDGPDYRLMDWMAFAYMRYRVIASG